MSYFLKMFHSPDSGFRTFLVHVTKFEECAIYSLDEAGEPEDLCTGKIQSVIGSALESWSPRLRIAKFGPREGQHPRPSDFGFGVWGRSPWSRLVDRLNAKGIRAAEARERRSILFELGYEFPWFEWDGIYRITAEGRRVDALLDEEPGE